MLVLVVGLVLFLGSHSLRIVAPGWRDRQVSTAPQRFKGLYSIVSLVGLVLIVWGYGMARGETVVLYTLPRWATHLASLLVVLGFVALAAAYVPRGRIAARLRHPMVTGVILWSAGHLLVNGDLAALLLFGTFLVWSVVDRVVAGARTEPLPPAGPLRNDLIAIVVGVVAALVFVLWLHGPLIGVAPYA